MVKALPVTDSEPEANEYVIIFWPVQDGEYEYDASIAKRKFVDEEDNRLFHGIQWIGADGGTLAAFNLPLPTHWIPLSDIALPSRQERRLAEIDRAIEKLVEERGELFLKQEDQMTLVNADGIDIPPDIADLMRSPYYWKYQDPLYIKTVQDWFNGPSSLNHQLNVFKPGDNLVFLAGEYDRSGVAKKIAIVNAGNEE